jgi:ATP-dependent helicase HrpA
MKPSRSGAVMRRDVFKLSRMPAGDDAQALAASSEALFSQRQQLLTNLNLDPAPGLPVSEEAGAILSLIQQHQVVIVAGETGSGKTTQLPKVCLQAGLGVSGMIGHTQPRRIAARAVAQRIAQETGGELGAQVGYAVRFSDQTRDDTLVKIMTDGLLLAEIRQDRFLEQYDAIIVDEAHERTLNIDFLLGYLKRLIKKRPDLKVIVTSATIDVDRFAAYFDNAPVVSVGGRTFPVQIEYRDDVEDPEHALVSVLEEIDTRPVGKAPDVLVFFSGEREIFDAARQLRKHFVQRFEILPLYARLSAADQRRVFSQSSSRRRIVLATNVAETSLTVPNIGYVVDSGFARVSRYSYRSKLQRLPIEPISQASANQRMGRCGRIAPGVCYRLYGEQDFLSRPAFTDAEIRRVNLASVVLQMQALGLGDIHRFPFIDPPEPKAIKDAMRLLEELRAIEKGRLTPRGRKMSRIPVDPRLSAMLIASSEQGCLTQMLIIVSGLAAQDVRERPMEKAQAADTAHDMFLDDQSDFVMYLNLWRWIEQQRSELSNNRWKAVLRKRFINPVRVREWREIHRQIKAVCHQVGLQANDSPGNYRQLHESILVGSLSQIAQHEERGKYLGPRNQRLNIFPGSGLAKRTPKWIVASEIVETRRVFARGVAAVESAWIEAHAQHLLRRRSSDPVWSMKRGEVVAFESISLYGLVLAERRPVAYFKTDPDFCRDQLIREGLVRGAVQDPPKFLRHNLGLAAQILDAEAKGRRRDLLISEDDLYARYAHMIPAHVCRISDLRQWFKRASRDAQQALFFTEADLLRSQDVQFSETEFPAQIEFGGLVLPLSYLFAPGQKDDGISVTIPAGLLQSVSHQALQWSVPGMLPALVEQWLRALPKNKRKLLAPMPDKVQALVQRLLQPNTYRQGRLLSVLATLLRDLYRVQVATEDWDQQRLPEHLRLFCKVVDDEGKVLASGRDLQALKDRLKGQTSAIPADFSEYQQTNIQALPLSLPDHVVVQTSAGPTMGFPGLRYVASSDRPQINNKAQVSKQVDLAVFATAQERDAAARFGFAQLALIKLGKPAQFFRRELAKQTQLGLYFASMGNAELLTEQCLLGVAWYCYFDGQGLPKSDAELDERLAAKRGEFADVFRLTLTTFEQVLKLRFELVRKLDQLQSPGLLPSANDMLEQLNVLVPRDVLAITPWRYLPSLPFYLRGLDFRLQQLRGHVPKDRSLMEQVVPLHRRLSAIGETELYDPVVAAELHYFLQELRLKLFAEPVALQKRPEPAFNGSGWKVSLKRVEEKIRQEEQRVGLA